MSSGFTQITPARPAADAVQIGEEDLALIRLIADGLVLSSVARRMYVSERTVRRRVRSLCDRVGVETPVQVAVWAARTGVL